MNTKLNSMMVMIAMVLALGPVQADTVTDEIRSQGQDALKSIQAEIVNGIAPLAPQPPAQATADEVIRVQGQRALAAITGEIKAGVHYTAPRASTVTVSAHGYLEPTSTESM